LRYGEGARKYFSKEECGDLLQTTNIGRVALSLRALPGIVPIQYYVDGRRIAICLGHNEIPE